MKPITLHPASVVAGLALAGLVFFASGAVQTPIPTRTVFVGEVPPNWWTYVVLSTAPDGTPIQSYAVPVDHHFVVTACSISSFAGVLADGQDSSAPLASVNQALGREGNGTRVPFLPGTLLTESVPGSIAYLWGYLEPVR
jgi:hypothetical protein